jgi:hypothetical protein
VTNGRELDKPATYKIRVKGDLDLKWGDWFDGFDITPGADDTKLLSGTVADQAALYGVLLKLHSLGLVLLFVQRVWSPPKEDLSL